MMAEFTVAAVATNTFVGELEDDSPVTAAEDFLKEVWIYFLWIACFAAEWLLGLVVVVVVDAEY